MKKKIRICNIVCNLTSGGVESVLLNYFSHLDSSRYELDLITYGINSKYCAECFEKLGFNIIKVIPKRNNFFKSILEMNAIIKKGRYDIVHAHLTEWNCIPMFLSWKNNIPIRISHSHMNNVDLSLIKKGLFFVQKIINKCFANKFCACGIDAAYYLYGTKFVKSNKVIILNNAIDVKRFLPNKKVRCEIRKNLNIDKDTLCVGHIGRFTEQKNHKFLIDIFEKLHNKKKNSCLLLIGTGELEKEIYERVEKKNLKAFVRFLGVRNDIENIYQAMDVFCLPSLYEGLPVVGIEAQAAQIPTLVSDSVSNSVKITPFIEMMSLKKNDDSWAERLLSLHKDLTKKNNNFPHEYDIEKTAFLWKELYE